MSNQQSADPRARKFLSFGDLLKEFEQTHTKKPVTGEGREGTVVAISGDLVFLDLGMKEEGALPAASLRDASWRDDRQGRRQDAGGHHRATIREGYYHALAT